MNRKSGLFTFILSVSLIIVACTWQPRISQDVKIKTADTEMQELLELGKSADISETELKTRVANTEMREYRTNPPSCTFPSVSKDRNYDRRSYHYNGRNRSPEKFEIEGYDLEDDIKYAKDDEERELLTKKYYEHLDKYDDLYGAMADIDEENRKQNYAELVREARAIAEQRQSQRRLEAIRIVKQSIVEDNAIAGKNNSGK